jgi:uncharacterized membrane protein YhdT
MINQDEASQSNAEQDFDLDFQKVMRMLSEWATWASLYVYQVDSSDTYFDFDFWDHFQLCCLEIIIFFIFIYFLKTKLLFDVLGAGPIAMLINSVTNNK